MPQFSIKLCTYDPVIINAFGRLRKNRKHAAYTHEALKHFLATEKGIQVLSLMETTNSVLTSTLDSVPPVAKPIFANIKSKLDITATSNVQDCSSDVLASILKY